MSAMPSHALGDRSETCSLEIPSAGEDESDKAQGRPGRGSDFGARITEFFWSTPPGRHLVEWPWVKLPRPQSPISALALLRFTGWLVVGSFSKGHENTSQQGASQCGDFEQNLEGPFCCVGPAPSPAPSGADLPAGIPRPAASPQTLTCAAWTVPYNRFIWLLLEPPETGLRVPSDRRGTSQLGSSPASTQPGPFLSPSCPVSSLLS